MRGTAYIMSLREARDARQSGNKAIRLARLLAEGFPVPEGFVISQSALHHHLKSKGLETLVAGCLHQSASHSAVRRGSSEMTVILRRRLGELELLGSLQRELKKWVKERGNTWSVAVRSSAIGEDDDDNSFAGQLETVLSISDFSGLERAIKTVWASPWSERCLAYAADRQLALCRNAVIVQDMVAAQWSGVIFTHDPLVGVDPANMVIEIVNGLGDQLVSGRVTPLTLRISRDGGCFGGPEVPDALKKALYELGRLALKIEMLFGTPQDIEWSIDHTGRIWILQARPITALANTADQFVWSNANIAENFPDPVCPLLFSIVRRGYTAYFRNLAHAFGFSAARIQRMSEAFEQIVGVHHEHLYYNVTYIHRLIRLAPFGNWLVKSFNEFTGITNFPEICRGNASRITQILELIKIGLQTTGQYVRIEQRIRRFEDHVDNLASKTRIDKLRSADAAEVLRHLRAFLHIRLVQWTDASLADVAAMVTYSLLKRLTHVSSEPWQNDLLKGLPNLASVRPAVELWQLSRQIPRDPTLAALFNENRAETINSMLQSQHFRDFRAGLDTYLEQWGFRYSAELMLTRPSPQEDPLPVIRLLQRYAMETGDGPDAICERQAHDRMLKTEAIAARMTANFVWRRCWFSRAGRFRLLLRLTQGAIALRERARMKQALLYTRLRHIALRAGEILCQQGWLTTREDVFFLTIGELMDLLTGASHTPDASSRIAAARREAMIGRPSEVAPHHLVLVGGAHWRPTPAGRLGDRDSETMLVGTTACGGTAEGSAAVVLDVTEATSLQAGDILVTSQTDPGWAAVFFLINGLVVERGGMLSHGAIIAREYGIPAIVGVNGATRKIVSGRRIRLRADDGRVELLNA